MKRRNFLVAFWAAACGLLCPRAGAHAGPSYVYFWNAQYTDDPAFAGPGYLPLGVGNRIFLDGREVHDFIRSAQTGANGWVEVCLVRDKESDRLVDGAPLVGLFEATQGGKGWFERYYVSNCCKILRGRVEYRYDPPVLELDTPIQESGFCRPRPGPGGG